MSTTTFTVGDLRRALQGLDDVTKLSFDGGLTFSQLKRWGDDEFVLLFVEPQAFLEPPLTKNNPHIKVAFVRSDDVECDKKGAIGIVDVSIR